VDAGVRNLNLVVDVWKLESFGDFLLDLGEVPSGSVYERHRGLSGLCVSVQIKLDAKIFASERRPPGFFEVSR